MSACAQLAVQATQLDAGAKAEVAEAAEAMLQVPIARLLDVSSFVRCRALGALLQLLEARPTPLTLTLSPILTLTLNHTLTLTLTLTVTLTLRRPPPTGQRRARR